MSAGEIHFTAVKILFDDMTRPTRVYELIPQVLEQLYEGGIEKKSICFLCARAHTGP